MEVILYKKDGTTQDITILNADIEMSGDLRKVSRDLTINITRKGVDYYMPAFEGERGDSIATLDSDGNQVYKGVIWDLDINTSGTDIELTCYDSLIYMNKSESKDSVFVNKTAEEVTAQVVEEFGLEVGDLAETGHVVRLNGRGKTGYEIMMSAYTEVSRSNDKKYYPLIRDDKVCVIEKGEEIESFIIEYKGEGLPGHLISLKYGESSEEMVNKIITVDDSGNISNEDTNEEDISKYGLVQKVAQDASDTTSEVKDKLKLNSGKKTVELECIGDWRLRTGYSVRVKSDQLGFDEVLYIESDKHRISNGLHYTNLVLSYENEMDEHEMKEDKSSSGGFGGSGYVDDDSTEARIWNYLRAKGFSKAGAAAVLGNMFQETGGTFSPSIIEGGTGIGFGLLQWSFSRRTDLMNWASANGKDPKAVETQLDFMIHELESGYPGLLEELKNISDPKLATDKFHDIFVRSNDKNANWKGMETRYREANNYFNDFGNREINNQVSSGSGSFHAIASEYKTMYLWGGSHLTSGEMVTDPNARYDCSSFARAVMYRWKGVDIGTYTVPQENAGVEVPISEMREGDLLFYGARGRTHHIAIYAGNGKMYEAQMNGVPIGLYPLRAPSFVKRVE